MDLLQKSNAHLSYYRSKKDGFTLIETLIGVAVIALTGAAILDMLASALYVRVNTERRILATKIAQEGMELFVSKRNNNVLCIRNNTSCTLADWKDNLVGSFEIEATNAAALLPGPPGFASFDSSHYICVKANSPLYQLCQSGNEILPGLYTRRITATALPSPEKIRVVSRVEWDNRQGERMSLELERILFNTFP